MKLRAPIWALALAGAFGLFESDVAHGAVPDLAVTATLSPGLVVPPGTTGTIELRVENIGSAPATLSVFGFSHSVGGAGGWFAILRTLPPCSSAAFVGDPLPPGVPVTGRSGSFGRLEPGESASCTAEFFVYPGASGVVRVDVGASDQEENYSNNHASFALILGQVGVPVVEAPAVVPVTTPGSRMALAAILLLSGVLAYRGRR